MKTIIDVLNEVLGEEIADQGDIAANIQYLTTLTQIQKCMQEYAKEAVRELVTHGDHMCILKSWVIQPDIMHGTSTDEDNLQKWMDTL